MERVSADTNVFTLYPAFVLVKQWAKPQAFNDRLFEIGVADAERFRVLDAEASDAVGQPEFYFSHRRHNLFLEHKDPTLVELLQMADAALRDYLWHCYGVDHKGTFALMADVFHGHRQPGHCEGIVPHTHMQGDLIVNYYPRVAIDPDAPKIRRGALRLFDPSGKGKRSWPNRNPAFHAAGWFNVEVETGTMVVFEGHVPHDSTVFDGDARMCIAIMARTVDERSWRTATVDAILRFQQS
jgi:hypothetical protein